ncbi:hypothetical protein GA0111570_11150 [Raineyella antarctica]|uniref:Uncharacterized protein n=1 Tax=Raineyella antarctica TaxID=1577474 RepID=A0A1G6HKN6_9ACTN|nr:CPP1-like family protein [Raineyella antarctica]SDB94867.1 hypothetical protein GA0111570_11150 [Raineyella antarctica]
MDTTTAPASGPPTPVGASASLDTARRPSRWRTAWASIRAAIGALLGLVPHVMHHIGILAGAALLTGVFGNTVLYAAGLLLSIPLLNRLRKRFGTWKAPAIGVAVFTAMFLLSALIIGPAINRAGTGPAPQTPLPATSTPADHEAHHGG